MTPENREQYKTNLVNAAKMLDDWVGPLSPPKTVIDRTGQWELVGDGLYRVEADKDMDFGYTDEGKSITLFCNARVYKKVRG